MNCITRRSGMLAILVVATGLGARSVLAQTAGERIQMGLAAGRARASGIGGGTGYHALATITAPTRIRPVSLRVDGTFGHWGTGGEGRVASLSAGVNVGLVQGRGPRPNVSAMAGTYYTPRRSGLVPGWSLGVGVQSRRGVFIESRVHALKQDGTHVVHYGAPDEDRLWKYVWMPLSIGFRF